jgi:hypothetical protein
VNIPKQSRAASTLQARLGTAELDTAEAIETPVRRHFLRANFAGYIGRLACRPG